MCINICRQTYVGFVETIYECAFLRVKVKEKREQGERTQSSSKKSCFLRSFEELGHKEFIRKTSVKFVSNTTYQSVRKVETFEGHTKLISRDR